MLQSFSVLTGTFQRLLVLFKGFVLRLQKSFFCLSAWRSSIIPHPGAPVNTFRQVFSCFFKFFFLRGLSGRFFNHSVRRNQQAQKPELPSSAPAPPLGQTLQFASGCAIIIYTLYCAAKEALFHDPHRQHRQHPYHCGRLRPRHTPVLRSTAF